jgi:hypothetical protein
MPRWIQNAGLLYVLLYQGTFHGYLCIRYCPGGDCPKTKIQKGIEFQLAASLDHTQIKVTTKDCHNFKNSGA